MRVQAHVRMPISPASPCPPRFRGRYSKAQGAITKAEARSDGAVIVTGCACDASVDCQGEILDLDRTWPYLEAFMRRMKASSGGKNLLPVRVQHDAQKIAGHCTDVWREGPRLMVRALISDPQAIEWLRSGTLSQMSLAGHYRAKEPQPDGTVRVICDPREVSLVDLGCNAGANVLSVEAQPDFANVWNEAVTAVKCATAHLQTNFEKGETNMGKTCANCNSKAQKAEEHVKAVKALRDQIEACAKSGHAASSYGAAAEEGRSGIRGDAFGDHVSAAATGGGIRKGFYAPGPVDDRAGGLVRAS